MSESARFCSDCPLIPQGVTAEVGAIRLKGNENAKIGELTAVIVTSEVPGVEVGDEANSEIELNGKSPSEIRDAIDSCSGPIAPKRLAAMLGSRGVCQGVRVVE